MGGSRQVLDHTHDGLGGALWLSLACAEHKARGVDDGEVGAVRVLGTHHNGLGTHGRTPTQLLQVSLCAVLDGFSHCRGGLDGGTIVIRMLVLHRARGREGGEVRGGEVR